jgi:membrane protein
MQTPPAVAFVKRLVAAVMDDEVPDLAAGLAYRFLFAIFPFAIFLAALAGFVAPALGMGDPTGRILAGLSDNLPPDVAQQLRPQLEAVLGQTRPGLLSIGAVLALWAATGGVGAVIKAMNKAYDVDETRGFVRSTATALALTILGTVGILVAFVTIVGGSVLTEQAVNAIGIGDAAWTAVSILRFPVVLALVALAVAVLFKLGPNVRVSFRWTLVGGVVFAVGWLAGTVLFSLYVANFASYADTYGALGGVVVLMLWFYLTGLLLLVAAEITSLLAKEHEPHVIEARRREIKGAAVDADADAPGAADADGDPERGSEADRGPVPDLGVTRGPRVARRPQRRVPSRATSRPGPAEGRSPGVLAAVVVGVGVLAGAILGRLSGEDDDGAASR